MKVGDLIEYTVVGSEEKALGIVLKAVSYTHLTLPTTPVV